MKTVRNNGWFILTLLCIVLPVVMTSGIRCTNGYFKTRTIRTYIRDWLSETDTSQLFISSSCLKETILNDWENQKDLYQIVSLRNPDHYNEAGHIPQSINIYWIDVVNDDHTDLLDPDKTQILYCYYGHGSMISYTILSLLGYRCRSLNFGMMSWNLDALVKEPWDQNSGYDVEIAANKPAESFPPSIITSQQDDARSIIKERAKKYLSGEGSPVIISSDVKAIVDDWDHKKAQFQIVDVRSEREYHTGHVPYSIHIPWMEIADNENLKKLDPNKTIITYSENGQTGQAVTTLLNLLGYSAVNMKFGMMDWNKAYVDKHHLWNGAPGYPVEFSVHNVELNR